MKEQNKKKETARDLDALSQTLSDGYETMLKVVEHLERDGYKACAEMFRKEFMPPFENGPKLLADAAGMPNLNIHHIVARPVMGETDVPLSDDKHRILQCYYTGEDVWVSDESFYDWVGDEDEPRKATIPPCMEVRHISMFAAVDPDGPMKDEGLTLEDVGFSDILQVYANHKHDKIFSAAFDAEEDPKLAERNTAVLRLGVKIVERLKSMGLLEEDDDLSGWTTNSKTAEITARVKDILDSNPSPERLQQAVTMAMKATRQEMPLASMAAIKAKLHESGLGQLAEFMPEDDPNDPLTVLKQMIKIESGESPDPLTIGPAQ